MENKIDFDKTGRFTEKQEKLCEKIAECLKELKKSGCSIIAKQDRLKVYKTKEIKFSNLLHPHKSYSEEHVIPYLSAGYIDDSGADDMEFFIDECLL